MKLVKSLLLGSASALVAVAGAQAADLPARKAAPVDYVRVCDAYGAGFFYIPGTDTCIKVGGRVRADFTASQTGDVFRGRRINATATGLTGGPTINTATGVITREIAAADESQNIWGWEARGRVDLDARTQTPFGTVQAVASLRLSRTTGVLSENIGGAARPPNNNADATLEAAYIRFAGFTFGAARDNFSFMPSTFYGAGHWASFANGAKQIAYTAVLGGGLSATLAIQDMADTTNGGVNAVGFFDPVSGLPVNPVTSPTTTNSAGEVIFNTTNSFYAYNSIPQVNGRLDWDQGWGSASIMGAVGQAVSNTATGTASGFGDLNTRETVWAVGAGLKVNLPMIAAGDVLYLNAAYADGMTEYTVNWLYFKSSDTRRNTTGFVTNLPSWVNYVDANGNAQIDTIKSWNLAALFTHYWTPQWRHSFLVTGGRVEGTGLSNSLVFGVPGAFGDATVWNVGTQLAWLPVRNFEIGVDLLYNRVSQDIVYRNVATGAGTGTIPATVSRRETEGNFTGRLRVERTF